MVSAVVGQSWLGTIPGWLTLAVLLSAAWTFRHGAGGTAIDSLDTANRVLERRVKDLETDGAAKDRKIAELTGRTDVALALGPVLKWTAQHEERAQSRHEATLGVLSLIAERLGPETTDDEPE